MPPNLRALLSEDDDFVSCSSGPKAESDHYSRYNGGDADRFASRAASRTASMAATRTASTASVSGQSRKCPLPPLQQHSAKRNVATSPQNGQRPWNPMTSRQSQPSATSRASQPAGVSAVAAGAVSRAASQVRSNQARPSQARPIKRSASQCQELSAEDSGAFPGEEFLEVAESNDTEVVFCREGVSVRPTTTEVIQGKLSVLRQRRALFLTWLPHNPGSLQEDGTFRPSPDAQKSNALAHSVDRTAYAVHALPLADVKALRKYMPAFGSHHVVVILSNGLTLPPLFFGQGGVRAFLSALKEHAVLTKSAQDPAVYLINDTSDPLRQSLAALELPDVLLGAVAGSISSAGHPRLAGAASEVGVDGSMAGSRFGAWGQLARVKQLARDTTSSFFAAQDVTASMMAGVGATSPTAALDPIAAAGEAPLAIAKRQNSFTGATAALRTESLEEDVTDVGTFELLDRAAADGSRSRRRSLPGPPLTKPDLESLLGPEGQLADERHFRKRVFECGCDVSARKEAWKFLLGMHPRAATGARRAEEYQQRASDYRTLRAQWSTISDHQAAHNAKWRERKCRVDKDVRRTDRSIDFFAGSQNDNVGKMRSVLLSYVMFNSDLGYCQGMSDLAAPMLYVMGEEAEAYAGFEALMNTFQTNFNIDGTGMHRQLAALKKLVEVVDPGLAEYLEDRGHSNYYFTFRWLLVQFKREVSFDEVLRLWEALWAAPAPHFHMWCVLAVLQQHRPALMASAETPDGPLQFCIKLQGALDVEALLRDAALLADYAGEAGKRALDSLDLPFNP